MTSPHFEKWLVSFYWVIYSIYAVQSIHFVFLVVPGILFQVNFCKMTRLL